MNLLLYFFKDDNSITDFDITFMGEIICQYVDILDPKLIDDRYIFSINSDKFEKTWKKAFIQVKEGKFKNIMFKPELI